MGEMDKFLKYAFKAIFILLTLYMLYVIIMKGVNLFVK
jgi:hypothetical protein